MAKKQGQSGQGDTKDMVKLNAEARVSAQAKRQKRKGTRPNPNPTAEKESISGLPIPGSSRIRCTQEGCTWHGTTKDAHAPTLAELAKVVHGRRPTAAEVRAAAVCSTCAARSAIATAPYAVIINTIAERNFMEATRKAAAAKVAKEAAEVKEREELRMKLLGEEAYNLLTSLATAPPEREDGVVPHGMKKEYVTK